MILEALVLATQSSAPGARESGLSSEQAAIAARYLRCRRAWRPHLEKCRASILAGAALATRRDRAVVLGSGCLLDIPLSGLSERFGEVVLVDVAHPLHARMMARRLGNVVAMPLSLVDLGSGSPGYRSWRDAVPGADYVVASMLLSQLPPPRAASPDPGWRRALVAQALADLGAGGEAACLVTETDCVLRRRGAEPVSEDPLHGIAAPPALERWRWLLAPPGERSDGTVVELEVAACLRPGGRAPWLAEPGSRPPGGAEAVAT